MRRFYITLTSLFLLVFAVTAQSPKDEFKKNLRLSGNNFLAYPGPTQRAQTPAPAGMRPFYISHYGRHGSRYQTKSIDYDYAYEVLLKASSQKALTPLGSDVLRRLALIRQEAQGRLGDLTPLGAQQQKDIAKRMVECFPEVFEGEAVVEARSTITPRCILSMSNFVNQLLLLNPRMVISQDASEHDLYYLKHAYTPVGERDAKDHFKLFCDKYRCYERVVGQLFADTAYLHRYVNGERLCFYLFREASNLQSSELSKSLTLYDLFTNEEIYEMWLKENASWFLGFGFTDLSGDDMPYSQSNLLRNIIEQADSCIRLPKPGCTLRFGHETMLLPLACLMGLNGFGQRINDLEQLERKGWICYRIFPMAANIQLIFYRSDPSDKDVLFKVLLNENEATLPLKSDKAPYYHWSDFREHYLQMLDDYKARHLND